MITQKNGNIGELIELVNLINQFFLIYGEEYDENTLHDNNIKHIKCKNTGGITNHIFEKYSEKWISITSPIPQKDKNKERITEYIEKGYSYFFVDGTEREVHNWQLVSLNPEIYSWDMLIRKLNIKETDAETIHSVVEAALKYGDNKIKVIEQKEDASIIYEIVDTNCFTKSNHNNTVELEEWIPNLNMDIYSGGIIPLGKFKNSLLFTVIEELCQSVHKSLKTPLKEFPNDFISFLINGTSEQRNKGGKEGFACYPGFKNILANTSISKKPVHGLSIMDYCICNITRSTVFRKSLKEILKWIKFIPANYNGKDDFIKMKEQIEHILNDIISKHSLSFFEKYKIEDLYPLINQKQNSAFDSTKLLIISFAESTPEINHPNLISYKVPFLKNIVYEMGVEMALMACTPEIIDKSSILNHYGSYRQIDYERMLGGIFKEAIPLIFNENPLDTWEIILPESYLTWLNLNSDVNLVKIGKRLRETGGKIKIYPKEIYEELVVQSFKDELESMIEKEEVKSIVIDCNIPDVQVIFEQFIKDKFPHINSYAFKEAYVQNFIGDCLWELQLYAYSLPYYLYAAEKGIDKVNIRIAYAYHYGIGTNIDETKALEYYRKALESGFGSVKPITDYLSGVTFGFKTETPNYSYEAMSETIEENNLSFDVEETAEDTSFIYEQNQESDINDPFDV